MHYKNKFYFFYRKFLVALVFMLATLGNGAMAQDLDAPKFTLKFKLTVKDGDLKHALVTITKNGMPYRVIDPSGGKYNVDLDLNAEYVFSCTKMGFISKAITVDTHIPTDREKEDFAKFTAEVELTKQPEESVVTYSQPVGRIKYELESGDFGFDKDYTATALEMQKKAEATPIPKPKPPEPNPRPVTPPPTLATQAPSNPIPIVVKQPEYKSEPEKPKEKPVETPPVAEKPKPKPVEPPPIVEKPKPKVIEPVVAKKPTNKNIEEKIIQEDRRKLTIVTVTIDGTAYIYKKEEYSWGGIYFYKDGKNITEGTFEKETE